jgi:hypothetical protein
VGGGVSVFNNTGPQTTLKNLIIHGQQNAGGSNAYGINAAAFGSNVRVYNCSVFGVRRTSGFGGTVGIFVSSTVPVENCIVADVHNVSVATSVGISGGIVKNSVAIGCVTGFSANSGWSSNNASDDATAPGTGSITNIAYRDNFESGLTGNPNLRPGSALIGAGVAVTETVDAAGNTYGSPPSIGPLEFVSAGGVHPLGGA